MIRYLIIGLGLALILALWRIDHVTSDRDSAVTAVTVSDAKVASLLVTLRLQRELATDQAAIETDFLKEKQRAEDEADRLRRCRADGSCWLQVAATCPSVRVDGAGTAAGEPDAGSPRLTAAAERAYPALISGLKTQRAQIAGLQAELILLHSKCKIIGASQ
ncbi:lysis system i-spanin subunit Rz [Pseudomonas anguilliseptica]|uniref:lysis system i-spanin subunit Rz n=1 Tax=Pseudomonas anguilliseptica TaxID=53406 RepID=UPI0022B01B1B|nr:lysis system i-spanin subunit Rz [Pseudomonas anguilliseptica]MCZ4321452.1 lysis system i-spanin subunit Rz [Pseudomonas anguilliseptica]